MSTNSFINEDFRRKRLLRELLELGELSTQPAIHYSRALRAEIKAEREVILTKLRELPLAV